MHVIAQAASGGWTFGGSILTFAFPMLLFIAVAAALFILYTKPEAVPGHDAPAHPVAYTRYPGRPAEAGVGSAAAGDAGAPSGSVPPDSREPGAGE